ncbi:MAG: hypothetical protein KAR47_17845, partial [Planctomycetes bacterium]|nr:hypothetical protein [Planctomycetota bacterium]
MMAEQVAAKILEALRVSEIAGMLGDELTCFGVPVSERRTWEHLAKQDSWRSVIKDAEKLLTADIPDQPDELYLDYYVTGNRDRWQSVASNRRKRVGTYVLAECLEDKGRFILKLEEIIDILCSEKSWLYPAHDKQKVNFEGERVDIALGSSRLAWTMAMADYLLGDKLSSGTRQKIRRNLQWRILEPFRDMVEGRRKANWWLNGTNNWNSVCLAGVVGTALATVESPEERAFYIAAVEKYSESFLEGFTDDGYCSEGLGYWNYGFGHYLMMAELIVQATGGGLDLLARDKVRAAATFPVRIEIGGGLYPAFADCTVTTRPASVWMAYVSRRFGLGLRRWEDSFVAKPQSRFSETLMSVFADSLRDYPPAAPVSGLGLRDFFADAGVLICRPRETEGHFGQLSVALKGGHNDEHHNHNDVGAYVVTVGDEILLADPGPEVYTSRTFSSHRYESDLLNSFGHPVPLVAGDLQRKGRAAEGKVMQAGFTDEADTFVLDIASAYDVDELKGLSRGFVYDREGRGSLTITDEVEFSSPQSFGTALVTFADWEQVGPGSLLIRGESGALIVEIETSAGAFTVDAVEIDEDAKAKTEPTRIGINLKKPV